ncbi:MAG: DUF4175 family protein, partial [Xanthobacteraceae bacterium]
MTDGPQSAGDRTLPEGAASEAVFSRALTRARLAIFWERLWPALVRLAAAVGLFFALSWLGVWL